MKKLLFIDRDGTIIEEPPVDYLVDSYEKLHFLPNVIRNLSEIVRNTDFELVMITNQDGLGTPVFPEESFWGPHNLMLDVLRTEGIEFKEVLIDKTFAKDKAPTRKPFTGLVKHYMNGEYDLANSYVIGDRLTDVQLAVNLGAKGIMIGKSLDLADDSMVDREKVDKAMALRTEHWDEISEFLI